MLQEMTQTHLDMRLQLMQHKKGGSIMLPQKY